MKYLPAVGIVVALLLATLHFFIFFGCLVFFVAGLGFVWKFGFSSRHLIRRLTLGNAAGIFKDNLVPFGANAAGIRPKRPSTSWPPSPQRGRQFCLFEWALQHGFPFHGRTFALQMLSHGPPQRPWYRCFRTAAPANQAKAGIYTVD